MAQIVAYRKDENRVIQNPTATQSGYHEPHSWLEEKVYAKMRQRTLDLVSQSVEVLCKDKQRVSLATIVAKSKECFV